MDKLVRNTLNGSLPILLFTAALLAGFLALIFTAREEEPQIVVPVVDVLVQAPGISAAQVERQVTDPLEKLLMQIPGVEHVYSVSRPGQALVTLRFHVGENREQSILNTYNKLYSNQDSIPVVVTDWMLRPLEVDDVPILSIALWSDNADLYSDYELRRLAEDVTTHLQGIAQTSEVKVLGGRPRKVRILIDPESLAAHATTVSDLIGTLQTANRLDALGTLSLNNEAVVLETGDRLRTLQSLQGMVINVVNGIPVFLQDVAMISDGPDEPTSYTWLNFSPHHQAFDAQHSDFPALTISVAKQRGSNAVRVAAAVHAELARLRQELFPPEVHIEVLRDYGQTANEKVNNLTASLGFAVLTVVIFISIFLGWRPALVVGLAVPVCYGVTLALDYAFGYTINRVTLFALILSLGLLVDDPITGIDNISRFMRQGQGSVADRIVAAMAEIRSPLIMSTITIVLAFMPLAFITGMMGPYMAPMAFNVPVSVITSTVVAFLVTPWLSSKILNTKAVTTASSTDVLQSPLYPFYQRLLGPLLNNRGKARLVLWSLLGLFILACLLPVLRLVPLKLLPFDNKNEVQVVIDMPEGSTLESTAAMARNISRQVLQLPEIQAAAAYVGIPSPMDFNGMVRKYYQRTAPHMAELRLTLIDKTQRQHQSHAVVLRLRELLVPLATDGASIKVVEVPPGPPVMSTLVAELYGSTLTPYEDIKRAAQTTMQRLRAEPHVVEVDSYMEAEQGRVRFILDKQKAALAGITTTDVNQLLAVASQGLQAGYLPVPNEARPLPIELRLEQADRSNLQDFMRLQLRGSGGNIRTRSALGLDAAPQPMVSLGELGEFVWLSADEAIYHKDLRPVVFVTAELSGRTPAEVIADLQADLGATHDGDTAWQDRSFLNNGGGQAWQLPPDISLQWNGEGEWKITLDVFRDMGLAFAFALAAIFLVLRVQTSSMALSLIIMSAIPLTVIGIMPGFWLLNLSGERMVAGAPDPVLFTATAMIGMIALAGIVVRNSVILIEFISQARAGGLAIQEALIQAGAIRMRPILLTAGTTLLGNLVIILDPVFSGLALAIIFGILASTLFTLIVVPVVYSLVFSETPELTETSHDQSQL